jgi:hypothetical protein
METYQRMSQRFGLHAADTRAAALMLGVVLEGSA